MNRKLRYAVLLTAGMIAPAAVSAVEVKAAKPAKPAQPAKAVATATRVEAVTVMTGICSFPSRKWQECAFGQRNGTAGR